MAATDRGVRHPVILDLLPVASFRAHTAVAEQRQPHAHGASSVAERAPREAAAVPPAPWRHPGSRTLVADGSIGNSHRHRGTLPLDARQRANVNPLLALRTIAANDRRAETWLQLRAHTRTLASARRRQWHAPRHARAPDARDPNPPPGARSPPPPLVLPGPP